MIAKIRSLDTLFFKDGKPFSMGQDTWADGVFPPFPSVIYGALRTAYISDQINGYSEVALANSANIKINNIYYLIASELYLPMPLDLVEFKEKTPIEKGIEKEKKQYNVHKLNIESLEDTISNYPFDKVLMPSNLSKEVEQGFIDKDGLTTYLNTSSSNFNIKKLIDIVISEPKTGIGRNNYTNAAEEGMLYRVGMRRPVAFEFLVDFEWPQSDPLDTESSFFIKLGAENKVAEVYFFDGSKQNKIDCSPDSLGNQRFKLYLSTPAIFKKNGWHPDLHTTAGINAELVAAAVGKPLHIGGFDMKTNEPKTMFKAVPAGSVFYYKTTETSERIIDTLHGKSISEEMAEQGFGITYVGNW